MRRQSWWHVVAANSASKGNDRIVLTSLAHHATFNGYVGIPLPMQARLCNLSEKSIRTALRRLVKSGELFLYRKGHGRTRHNIYQITVSTRESVDTKRYRVTIVPLPDPTDFGPLRVLEETPIKGVVKPQF